ncbi:DUF499 domain-containing protein [bacterium]|nr:DUF499 domain-containing protein [bacterium]
MLKTVRDACVPHRMALNFSLAEQVEDLSAATCADTDGEAFFAKNHLTAGMRQLFDLGLRRLAGRTDQALFELTQAMGGGKTHTMIAFALIAADAALRSRVVPDLAGAAPFAAARVVAFSGRHYPDHFLWGEIAAQLGNPEPFRRYWQDGAAAPDERAWMQLIGDQPTLILLDELPPYLDNAMTRPVGAGTLAQVATAALSNLFSAALKLPRLCIVVSNLSGSYEGASRELRKAIKNIEQEARRQAKPITPVELGGDEIYQILKKRLFAGLPGERDVEDVVQAYAAAIKEAEKAKAIAKSTEQIADEIRASYPFHPSLKDLIALFRNNEGYRQTRGLMQFVSRAIHSVWTRPTNDVYLIGLQHLDLNDADVRDEVLRINDLRGAVATDIASGGGAHAETIDAQTGGDAAMQVATLLLSASLSTAVDGVKGLTKQRVLERLIAPNRSVLEFAEAFDHLKRDAWYLHRDESDAYFFSNVENLTKRLSTEAERAPANKIVAEMRRRLEAIFAPTRRHAYQELQALPLLDEVRLDGGRMLLVLSPDTKDPPAAAAAFYELIVQKNNLCILTGDGSDLVNLEEKTRMLYAVAKLHETLPRSHPQQEELKERYEAAEQEFNSTVTSTFNRVWYPSRDGLVATKLAMQFTANNFDGEEQIEKALAHTGASKLALDVEAEFAALAQRAEEVIWPENQKRVPWRDVRARALSTPRWLWLPANGLEQLRKLAEQRGVWRSSEDGYIEKGPFEKPKTSVILDERAYDEATGEATLEVTVRDAGAAPRIYWDTTPNVTARSHRLTDSKLVTDATCVWVVAEDPAGGHERGDPVLWRNRLTITHQPREGVGSRSVELHVVPRGTIRYTLNGANPAEGTVYDGRPIEIGDGETTIWCHAEHEGVTERRTFTIPPAGNRGIRIDPAAPARLAKLVSAPSTAEAFRVLAQARRDGIRLSEVSLEVGSGTRTASLRFGRDGVLTAEQLEQVIAALRAALGEDMAEVRLSARRLEFTRGHDLSEFVKAWGLSVDANEVEQ